MNFVWFIVSSILQYLNIVLLLFLIRCRWLSAELKANGTFIFSPYLIHLIEFSNLLQKNFVENIILQILMYSKLIFELKLIRYRR